MSSNEKVNLEALAISILNEYVVSTTTFDKDALSRFFSDSPDIFVRITGKNNEDFFVVSESKLIQLINKCMRKDFQSDINPMFHSILSNPVKTNPSLAD